MTNSASQPTAATHAIATCAQCGCKSNLPNLFQRTLIGQLCPACAAKRAFRTNRNIYLIFNLAAILVILYGALFGDSVIELGLLVIFSSLISLISLVMHETFHAIAAWLVGGHVFGIHIGLGPPLIQRWASNFYLGVSPWPLSGVCFSAFPSKKWIRLRFAIYVLAGPLFHALVVALLWSNRSKEWGSIAQLWYNLFFNINVIMLVINLLPTTTVTTAMGSTTSDGNKLLELLLNKLKPDSIHVQYFATSASFALQRKQNEQGLAKLEYGLVLYPKDELLNHLHGYLLFQNNRFEECLPIWRTLVEAEQITPNPLMQAIHFNNYAWIILMQKSEADHVDIAYRYASQAFAMAPWLSFIRGTMATVLLEKGDLDAAINYAIEAAELQRQEHSPVSKENVASNLAVAALGYFRQGNFPMSTVYLEEAKVLALEDIMVQKALQEIEQNTAP